MRVRIDAQNGLLPPEVDDSTNIQVDSLVIERAVERSEVSWEERRLKFEMLVS
jgi:hypothetical protein